MKKLIIGIAILIQCISVGAMENQRQNAVNRDGTAELVPAGFFDAGITRMNENIQNAIRTVSADRGALPNEITTLSTDYRSYFEGLRSQINRIYLEQMRAQQQRQEAAINEMTRERDAEISRRNTEIQQLRTRLNELAASTHATIVNLGDIDGQMGNIENDLRERRNRAVTVSVSELFSEGDFSDRADVFDRQLSDMSTSINVDGNSVGSAFDATQAVYNASVNTLALNIQRRYDESVISLIHQFDEHKRLLEEGYTQAISSLDGTIQRLTEENTRLERKQELMNLVNAAISSNYSLAGRPLIRTRGADVKAISDFLQRKSTMEDLYNKFQAFSNLYGRRDLGVLATRADLDKVQNWITTAQTAYSLYGSLSFPAPAKPYNYEEGGDSPGHRDEGFDGANINTFLVSAKSRIESGLASLGSRASSARSRLNSIWNSTAAAANVKVQMFWDHPSFWGNATNQLVFYKNKVKEGRFFQEYGGGWWRDEEGFVGGHHGGCNVGLNSGDARAVWNSKFVTRYNEALRDMQNAHYQRYNQLLDFETNPESELNRAYRQAGRTSPTCVDVPVIELDRLINQYNEFMRM